MFQLILFWRKIRFLHALILVFAFQLGVSLGFINYFCRTFGFAGRLIPLHLSIVVGLFLAGMLCAGLLLLIRPMGGRRLTGFFPALIPAAGFVVLAALYSADFAGNMLWGGNINYRLCLQYIFRRDLFQTELPFLSRWLPVAIAVGIVFIFAVYWTLSGALAAGLTELFLPGRAYSLFNDRRRAVKSGVVLSLVFSAYAGCLAVLAHGLDSGGIARAEPILSFFTNTNAIYDFNRSALSERLRLEEPRIRADYPAGQAFQKKP